MFQVLRHRLSQCVLVLCECGNVPGVEAQTVTVWHQADRYNVPRIVYLNKMDKLGANFHESVRSLEDKLGAVPYVIQLPIGSESDFTGVIDLLSMEKLIWPRGGDSDGRSYDRVPLDRQQDEISFKTASEARMLLVEQLANVDSNIGELFLSDSEIREQDLHRALRGVTLRCVGVPVLCGSSFKNKGVQPLLDAVLRYLPDPTQRTHRFVNYYKNNLCALAFKIIHDKQRGPLTFLRMYTGDIKTGGTVYNVTRDCTEKVTRLLQVSADELTDLRIASAGNIVAVAGLRQVQSAHKSVILSAFALLCVCIKVYHVIVVVLLTKLNRTVRFSVNHFLFTTMIGGRNSAITIIFLHCGEYANSACSVVSVHYQ